MVSKASEDLPEPDNPVITTSESRGSSTVTSLRLCSRAPLTTIDWCGEDITRPVYVGRRRAQGRSRAAVLDGRQVGAQSLPDLGRHQVADGVGGEVPEQADGPVDVLQDAFQRVADLDAQQPVHPLVPGLRQRVDAEAALDETRF